MSKKKVSKGRKPTGKSNYRHKLRLLSFIKIIKVGHKLFASLVRRQKIEQVKIITTLKF